MLITLMAMGLCLTHAQAIDGGWSVKRKPHWDAAKASVPSTDLRDTSHKLRWNRRPAKKPLTVRISSFAEPHEDPFSNPFEDNTNTEQMDSGAEDFLSLNTATATQHLDPGIVDAARPQLMQAAQTSSVSPASHEVKQLPLRGPADRATPTAPSQLRPVKRGEGFKPWMKREVKIAPLDGSPRQVSRPTVNHRQTTASQAIKDGLPQDLESLDDAAESLVAAELEFPSKSPSKPSGPVKWFRAPKAGVNRSPPQDRKFPTSSPNGDETLKSVVQNELAPGKNRLKDEPIRSTANKAALGPFFPLVSRQIGDATASQLPASKPGDTSDRSQTPDKDKVQRDLHDLFIEEIAEQPKDDSTVQPPLKDGSSLHPEYENFKLEFADDNTTNNRLKDLSDNLVQTDTSDPDVLEEFEDSQLEDDEDLLETPDNSNLQSTIDDEHEDLLKNLDQLDQEEEEEQGYDYLDSGLKSIPCDQVYNDRNCCEQDEDCREVIEDLRTSRISSISLNISPSFDPVTTDETALESLRSKKLAKTPSRKWRRLDGTVVAEGYFDDYRFGLVHIRMPDGKTTSIRYLDLSPDDLCFVNAWWGLPAECTLADTKHKIRNWTMMTFTWRASAMCHKPPYFEDKNLERYGHSHGPCIQPLMSAAHFIVNAALLPYNSSIHSPNECIYALGDYRVGSCAPSLAPAFPLSYCGALKQTGFIFGLWGFLQ